MATRRRYPSDHRAYFRVLESILEDEWLNSLSLADQMVFIRLLATLNRQESKDGRGFLPWGQLCAITATDRRQRGRKVVARLSESGAIAGTFSGQGWQFFVEKWPEIQGFAPARLRGDSDETPPLRGEERRGEESKRGAVENEVPDLGEKFFAELAAPDGNAWGVPLDPSRVKRWFRWKWHTGIKARGYRPRGLKRAVREWWLREKSFAKGKTLDQVLGEAELWCRNVDTLPERLGKAEAGSAGSPLDQTLFAENDGLVFETLEVAS